MEYFWHMTGMITAWFFILLLLGVALAGCVIPLLPGHPLILAAALIADLFLPNVHIAWYHWLILIVLCAVGVFGDNLFSLWGARRFGSTKAGLWGCLAGAVLGLFFAPWGLLIGPFAGAVTAELIVSRNTIGSSLHSGLGAFLGTLAGFLFKLAVALVMIVYLILLIAL